MRNLSFSYPRWGQSTARKLPLRIVLFLRWIAVAGQMIAVLVAGPVLGYPLPITPLLITIGALALVTFLSQRSGRTGLNDTQSILHFTFDIAQLTVLLLLTGGLTNPFAILILAPVTVAAAILSYRSIIILSIFTIIASIILAFFHAHLLPTYFFLQPNHYIVGLAVALILAIIFIATYIFLVAEEARRLSNALNLANNALVREQKLASLGALAAAAAHELGSPLGTIAIAAKELSKSLPDHHPARADADLLLRESTRCKDILAELAAHPESASKDHFALIPARALIELAAAPYARPNIQLEIGETDPDTNLSSLLLPRRPEIVHGLENILHNALEAAHSLVMVVVSRDDEKISLSIEDDGPGFPPDMLARIGEPYLTSPVRKENHMGLGIFIAQHLILQSGGGITFANRPQGGARITMTWPKEIIL